MGEEACRVLAQMGGSLRKPADAEPFYLDAAYKSVGGQQLTAKCMFCRR